MYQTESVILAFEAGAHVEVEVDLEPAITAIQLPGITVQAERRPLHLVREGFYDRRQRGLGSFLERDVIRRLGAAGDLCRVFDELRGFNAWSPYGRCVVSSGGSVGLRLTDGAGAAGMSAGCPPTFLVDGASWDGEMVASLSPIHVEAVEGYRGVATTPGRFIRGMGNPCGTILIWLRA